MPDVSAQPEQPDSDTLVRLSQLFSDLQPHAARGGAAAEVFELIVTTGVQILPGAEHAAITGGRGGRLSTIASSDELPLQVDAIQYELGYGPCVDAIRDDAVYQTDDLAHETRWPGFGERAVAETGVHSMLSFRMFLEGDDQMAGLNFYATKSASFGPDDRTLGLLLSTHGATVVSAMWRGETAEQLTQALHSNREIGVAMGILMAQHKLTREQAFDLLKIASQHTHRKLADLAVEVADTGTLELPRLPKL